MILTTMITADERKQRPLSREPEPRSGDDRGPTVPDVDRPGGTDELMKRLKKVDPDQAKKYRQRSGE